MGMKKMLVKERKENVLMRAFYYDKSEKIGDYIYFYKDKRIIAVYNPFVGLCIKRADRR